MLIKKNTSIDDIERYYSEVEATTDVIQIVNGYKSLNIGLIPRLAQFFITIAKKTEIPFEFSWVKLNEYARQDKIVNDAICVTAILMTDRVYGENNSPLKKMLNERLFNRFKQSVFKNGRQVQMMAIDHSIEEFSYPDCFYRQSVGGDKFTSRDSDYYNELLTSYFNDVNRRTDLTSSDFEALSELLAELIDNTDQHSKSEFTQGITDKSVRSVVLNSHLLRRGEDISNICGENNPTAEYINSIKNNNESLHLLEISIFDSGVGIFKSFKGDPEQATISQEAEVLFKSFLNGVTSKVNGIGVGRGLNKARLILNDRNGFISIRTGRLSVYRNYKVNSLENLIDLESPDIQFFDETTRSGVEYSEMNNVEGLSYTVLVPIL